MTARIPMRERIEINSMPIPWTGCWLWTGSVDRDGYGKMSGKETLAHRNAYSAFVRSIPPGLEIDHLCKERSCVNPAHLEAVTKHVNIARSTLRTVPSHNSLKTHCKRGHELSGENLYVEKWRGLTMRKCRTCRRDRQRIRQGIKIDIITRERYRK